jgi:hypothetical protein
MMEGLPGGEHGAGAQEENMHDGDRTSQGRAAGVPSSRGYKSWGAGGRALGYRQEGCRAEGFRAAGGRQKRFSARPGAAP